MPNKGSKAKGTNEVAGIGSASVTHQITVNKVMPEAIAALSSNLNVRVTSRNKKLGVALYQENVV